MLVEVVMPKMGESLQEGTIIKWLKNVGEAVERDEMILEISTDKVDTEVPSPVGGILKNIFAQANETIPVGQKIAEIETDASVSATTQEATVEVPQEAQVIEAAPAAGSDVEVVMPKMGESLQEGTIIKWLKNVGEAVERDEMILEISTDKVDTEVPSPVGGMLKAILAQANETVEVGKVIAVISTSGQAIPQQSAPKAAPAPEIKTEVKVEVTPATYDIPKSADGMFFSPLVRTIAEQEKVSLEELKSIKGSGLEGRITKDDLLSYIQNRTAPVYAAPVQQAITKAPEIHPAVKPEAAITPKVQVSSPKVFGADTEIIPMDRVRSLISEHMVYSVHTSPHVTSVGEADVTEIVKFRNKFRNEFEKAEGYKLTYTPFFAKAAIEGIQSFPMVNVSVDGNNIIRHRRINLSFATALDDGNLIVPVIKNADTLNLRGLSRSVFDLSSRARAKKLNPDEIQGGTFTITNVGTFGTLFGTPIINQPQVAIMGIGAIQKRPVVREFDGEHLVVIRDMAYISLTYDHRVVDGMLAGQCLNAIIKSLESMNENTIVM